MIINHNLSSMSALHNLNANNNSLQSALEHLSSGKRINGAADDAAGLAISEKMKGQINGLDQASRNAQDGISMIQTAEGALNETHSILQRMRDLATQSSNDTNTPQDRQNIQQEVDQLAQEITRISNTTQFNTQTLLNGGMQAGNLGVDTFQIGANTGQNIQLSIGAMDAKTLGVSRDALAGQIGSNTATVGSVNADNTPYKLATGNYTVSVTNIAAGAATTTKTGTVTVGATAVTGTANSDTTVTLTFGGQVTGTGAQTSGVNGGAGATNAASAMNFTHPGTIAATDAGNYQLQFTSATAYEIYKDDGTGTFVDTGNAGTVGTANTSIGGLSFNVGAAAGGAYDTATRMNFHVTADNAGGWTASGSESGSLSGATNGINGLNIDTTQLTGAVNGDTVTIKAYQNATSSVQLKDSTGTTAIGSAVSLNTANGGTATIGNTTLGEMTVSFAGGKATTGTATVTVYSENASAATFANKQKTSDAVAYGGIDVSSSASAASNAITAIDAAIQTVSAQRSQLGAYQNRLDHTINNLSTSSENLTSASSRITDVDMAKEMATFTKDNVLQQAAVSMLAQANQQPQMVLKLLG